MRRARPLPAVVLGPVVIGGRSIRLRPARYADFGEWRRIRLRDEAVISPHWATTELDWAARHTEKVWVRELLAHRDEARAGRSISFAIEVDGRFAGQCALTDVDPARHGGELGIWVDSTVAGRGVGQMATAMLTDYAFDVLGANRVVAPASTRNRGSLRAAAHAGLEREAVMASFMDVGGHRQDHELWSVLREPGRHGARVAHTLAVHDHVALPADPMPVTPAGREHVVVRTPAVARHVARYRAGRARARLRRTAGTGHREAPRVRAGDGSVALRAVDAYRRAARLVVDDDAARTGADDLPDAIRALLEVAFGTLGLCRVSAVCLVGDDARAAAYAAAGLRHEGTLRDHRDDDGRRGDHALWATTREP